jgi:hypothetical protein
MKQDKWRQPQMKWMLLRLGVFVLVLFGTYLLASWSDPLGGQRFFWNLVLGAVVFHASVRPVIHWLDEKEKKADSHALSQTM